MQKDYRLSHMSEGYGEAYDQTFRKHPYRKMIWDLEQSVLRQIISEFYQNKPISHLDFACGTGRILGFLQRYAQVSVGIDISSSMLEVARKKYRQVEFIETDITREPVLGSRKFTLITAFRFFPNAQPELRREAMGKLIQHLDDNGYIVFNNHVNPSSSCYKLVRFLKHTESQGLGMTTTEVEQLINEHGLVLCKSYTMGVIPSTDKHMLLPGKVLYLLEKCVQKLGIFRSLAQNTIFVCQIKK